MKDRIPANPGRVLIAPESGGAPYYATVTRADNPTQEGTALNKYNLLKDATAAMFGMGGGAVPDGVLQYIGKYAQHWWKRKALVTATRYKEKQTEVTGLGSVRVKFYNSGAKVAEEVNVDPISGEISLVNPYTPITTNDYKGHYFLGKAVVSSDGGTETYPNGVFYIENASYRGTDTEGIEYYGGDTNFVTAEAYQVDVGGTDFVQAPNAEAYPHSGSDGSFEYTYLGQPWENAVLPVKIASGSYVGTGGYKESAASSLTFDFAPKFLAINVDYNNKSGASVAIIRPDAYTNYAHVATIWGNVNSQLIGKVSGKTVYWYSTDSANNQMNASGYTYHYVAIG